MTLNTVSLRTNTVSLFSFCTDGCRGLFQDLQTVRAWKLDSDLWGLLLTLDLSLHLGLFLFTVSFGTFSMLPSSHIHSEFKIFYGSLKGDWGEKTGLSACSLDLALIANAWHIVKHKL